MFNINGIYRLKPEFSDSKSAGIWYRCILNLRDESFLLSLDGLFDKVYKFSNLSIQFYDKVGQR